MSKPLQHSIDVDCAFGSVIVPLGGGIRARARVTSYVCPNEECGETHLVITIGTTLLSLLLSEQEVEALGKLLQNPGADGAMHEIRQATR